MMTRILSNGVLGLTAQSHALGTISDNIANAQTVGFKQSETQFSDMVAGDRSSVRFDGAGVRADRRLLADVQGSVANTNVGTNAAINGRGFFIVQDQSWKAQERGAELTRTGDFQPDAFGQLVNSNGRALMGLKLDPNVAEEVVGGKGLNIEMLEVVSVEGMRDHHEGTSRVSFSANLPADQPIGVDAATAPTLGGMVEIVDNTENGKTAGVNLRFEKAAQNEDGSAEWRVYASDARYQDPATGRVPTLTGNETWTEAGTLSFGADGLLAGGEAGDEVTLGLDLGADFKPLTLSFGAVGSSDGMTQFKEQSYTGLRASQDGIAKGSFRDLAITDDGYVRASFAGGQQRDFFRVVNGTVRNTSDLESVSGTAFRATDRSGDITLAAFGTLPPGALPEGADGEDTGAMGSRLVGGAVEQSNTRIENQFTNLILAQRTYSASSKIISTADEMTQSAVAMKG